MKRNSFRPLLKNAEGKSEFYFNKILIPSKFAGISLKIEKSPAACGRLPIKFSIKKKAAAF